MLATPEAPQRDPRSLGLRGLGLGVYLDLPKPTFIKPIMEFIEILPKSRFWWVDVGFRGLISGLGVKGLGIRLGIVGLREILKLFPRRFGNE